MTFPFFSAMVGIVFMAGMVSLVIEHRGHGFAGGDARADY